VGSPFASSDKGDYGKDRLAVTKEYSRPRARVHVINQGRNFGKVRWDGVIPQVGGAGRSERSGI